MKFSKLVAAIIVVAPLPFGDAQAQSSGDGQPRSEPR